MVQNNFPRRVKASEVARLTGLSRATVDRALNKRGGLRPETERLIHEAYAALRNGAQPTGERADARTTSLAPGSRVTAMIRLGRGMTETLFGLCERRAYPLELLDMAGRGDEDILDLVAHHCAERDRPLIVGLKSSERLNAELAHARKRGKRIVTLISDLSPEARDAFIGIDNRQAGQAAAVIIGRGQRGRPAKVGVVLGDYAFRCHEDREIGFRSYLRSAFPNIMLTDAVKGDDSAEMTGEAVSALVRRHPDIDAIYNVAGGNAGLARALQEHGLARQVVVVSHEVNAITRPLVREGVIDFLIAQSPSTLLETALAAARESEPRTEFKLLDFNIHTRFNIPGDEGFSAD